ncbi:MAG: ethylbenzene dehydrogenase-related protein, partial [Candidatus Methanofastidiosia archaeon]
QSGNEDRIAFMFEITPVEGFRTNGCYVNCHSDGMYTNADGEKMDTWHWKAHRTNPLGYADDKYLDNQIGDDGGRHGDSKGEGNLSYSKNRTEDKSKPKYMQNPSIHAKDERFLLKDEAIEIKDYSIFKKGDTVPGYLLARPKGSRGDVNAVGKWSNGTWTVEFSRKLNTGNPDDVVFSPTKEIYFGVAVFDNTGSGNHTVFAKSIELMFEEEVEEKASASVIAILAGGALAVFLLRRKK